MLNGLFNAIYKRQVIQLRHVWLFAFLYTAALSLLFQKVVLPLLPSMHAGLGLLKNDAYFFHQSALFLADNIRLHGWSEWSLWSAQTNTSGNVGILSALYAFFSPSPALIIPINSFLHATSAATLMLIGRELWPGRAGYLAGLVTAALFIVFPSALSWYSQPMKDSYVIAGILLILFSMIAVLKPGQSINGLLTSFVSFAAGVLLLVLVKPYLLKLLLIVILLTAGLAAIHLYRTKHPHRTRILFFYAVASMFIFATNVVSKPYQFASTAGESYVETGGAVIKSESVAIKWEWVSSEWLPQSLEKNVELAARTRIGMIDYNREVGAGSLIDADAAPQSVGEVVQYLPRALQIGLFAPFPNTWLHKPSAIRLLAAAETACWYLIAPGLLLAFLFRRSFPLLVTLVFACFFLTILSFVTPNVGSLYRYRYAYEFLLIAVAAGGWIQFFMDRRKNRGGDAINEVMAVGQEIQSEPRQRNSRIGLLNSALMVSVLTLVGYLGFFARDLFMVRSFGTGNEMDIFFLGSMVPMFFVSILAIPVGTSITPAYLALRNSSDSASSSRLIANTLFFQTLLMAVLSILIFFFTPALFSLLGWQYTAEKLQSIQTVMNVYLFIMMIGGLIIVANAVLNAEGRLVFPALAQLAVPIVTILALLMFGGAQGIYAAVYGMLIGQIVNLLLVGGAVRGWSLPASFRPDWTAFVDRYPIRQYGILVAAALSSALFMPLANAIAAHLPSGSVAIIGMGTKVIILITGVIGAGMTTVLLPYFSGLAAKSNHLKAQSEFAFFLLLATILSVPIALLLRVFAAAVTYKLVAGSAMTSQDIVELIRTVQYGVAQLPFFVCSVIVIKFIVAYQRAGIILLSSFVGLVLTILLSKIFVAEMGVSGISLAITIALAISTLILVIYSSYLKHLPRNDSMFIIVNWLLFAAMFTSLHFHRIVDLIILAAIYCFVTIGGWKTLMAELRAKEAD